MGQSDFVELFYGGATSYDLAVIRLDSGKTNEPVARTPG